MSITHKGKTYTQATVAAGNIRRSFNEVVSFLNDRPDKYVAYVKVKSQASPMGVERIYPNEDYPRGLITTWMGDKLGYFYGGKVYRDNFGGKRISINVVGINGILYHGTYYASSGARIKAYANQEQAYRRLNYTKPTTIPPLLYARACRIESISQFISH